MILGWCSISLVPRMFGVISNKGDEHDSQDIASRRKMIEVMTLKGLAPVTHENYQRTVSALSRDCGRAPQSLSADEISAWVISRIGQGLCPRTTNADVSALRLFYNEAMGQPEKVEGLNYRRSLTVCHVPFPKPMSNS